MLHSKVLEAVDAPFQSFRGSRCSIPKLWRFMSMTFTYLHSKIEEIPHGPLSQEARTANPRGKDR